MKVIAGLAVAAFGVILFGLFAQEETVSTGLFVTDQVGIGQKLISIDGKDFLGKDFLVEVADDEVERIQGLSNTSYLGDKDGLLFVFEEPGLHGIWMKDMRFPIDIIWFGADMKVVSIEEDVAPETFPEIFLPDEPALYVLEGNAGFVQLHGIEIGDELRL